MRIRKRWPPPPAPPPTTTLAPPDLQSSTLQPVVLPPSSLSRSVLHQTHDPSVYSASKNLSPPCCDSPNNYSILSPKEDDDENRRRPDLQLVPVRTTNSRGVVLDQKNNSTHCLPPSSAFNQIGVGEENSAADEMELTETNRRIGYDPSAGTSAGSSISSSLFHQGHWCEEDKVFPLKKRRVSFRSNINDTTTMEERQGKKMNVRETRRRNNKKYIEDEDEDEDEKDRGKIIMEGSRCSRVNGRGWRCSQLTLVGYSLCEHHLGKGRLSSINCAPRRRTAPKISRLYEDESDNDNDDKKGLVAARKKRKIGVVKARSISSLLSQTFPSPPPLSL